MNVPLSIVAMWDYCSKVERGGGKGCAVNQNENQFIGQCSIMFLFIQHQRIEHMCSVFTSPHSLINELYSCYYSPPCVWLCPDG